MQRKRNRSRGIVAKGIILILCISILFGTMPGTFSGSMGKVVAEESELQMAVVEEATEKDELETDGNPI